MYNNEYIFAYKDIELRVGDVAIVEYIDNNNVIQHSGEITCINDNILALNYMNIDLKSIKNIIKY